MNYKRKKPRKQVRCAICTPVRWRGNSKTRRKARDLREMQAEER